MIQELETHHHLPKGDLLDEGDDSSEEDDAKLEKYRISPSTKIRKLEDGRIEVKLSDQDRDIISSRGRSERTMKKKKEVSPPSQRGDSQGRRVDDRPRDRFFVKEARQPPEKGFTARRKGQERKRRQGIAENKRRMN